ncbi:hypothetical protein NMY22_g16517 [Coprinellus aureogranulatus]|nr:hypothetical protein NMY22_g16517 [Coprinellus aureogranulatus]
MALVTLSDEGWLPELERLETKFRTLFETASSPADLTSALLETIRSNPHFACTEALAGALILSSRSSPELIDTFVPVVAGIYQSDLKGISINWSGGVHTFKYVFTLDFLTCLSDVLSSSSPEDYAIDSSNKRLNAALLSGVAIQHGLIGKNDRISGFAYNNGLALDKPPSAKNKKFTKKRAVSALVAGLMLLVGGKKMMEQDMRRFRKDDVANAFREKAQWFLEGSNERSFLEVRTFH